MEISVCCKSITGHQIATNFCTCHNSTAVVTWAKFCDNFVRIQATAKWNWHWICIVMKKCLRKGPQYARDNLSYTEMPHRRFGTFWSLTHWGWVMHICIGKLTIIDSDNGLSPGRRQAIIWTNTGIVLFGTLETNFSKILIKIQIFSLKKIHWKFHLRNVAHFISASMC